jgi:hypothetical protein
MFMTTYKLNQVIGGSESITLYLSDAKFSFCFLALATSFKTEYNSLQLLSTPQTPNLFSLSLKVSISNFYYRNLLAEPEK